MGKGLMGMEVQLLLAFEVLSMRIAGLSGSGESIFSGLCRCRLHSIEAMASMGIEISPKCGVVHAIMELVSESGMTMNDEPL